MLTEMLAVHAAALIALLMMARWSVLRLEEPVTWKERVIEAAPQAWRKPAKK